MSTQTNATNLIVADDIASFNQKMKGWALLNGKDSKFDIFYTGIIRVIDEGDKEYTFPGSLAVESLEKNPVNGWSFYVYVLDDTARIPCKPVSPYAFELVPVGNQPSTPEHVIDADALWPTWAAQIRAEIANEPPKKGKAKSNQTTARAATAAAVKPTIKDAAAKLEAALAAFSTAETGSDAWMAAAKAVGEAQAEVTRLRNERQQEQAEREAKKAQAEAEAKAQAEAEAHKAEFNRRYDLLKASRQELLNAAQAVIDALIADDSSTREAIQAAARERDSAKALLEHETLTAAVEESFAVELASQQVVSEPETPDVIEQPIEPTIEQVPEQPTETPEPELTQPVVDAMNAALNETLAAMHEAGVQELTEETAPVVEQVKAERKGRNKREKVAA